VNDRHKTTKNNRSRYR